MGAGWRWMKGEGGKEVKGRWNRRVVKVKGEQSGKGRMRDGKTEELSGMEGTIGSQKTKCCYAFPHHSFPPIRRAVKLQ